MSWKLVIADYVYVVAVTQNVLLSHEKVLFYKFTFVVLRGRVTVVAHHGFEPGGLVYYYDTTCVLGESDISYRVAGVLDDAFHAPGACEKLPEIRGGQRSKYLLETFS